MHLLQHDYIDFLSVALICLGVCNPGEAAEKPLRSRVERVASYLFHNLTLTFGGIEAKSFTVARSGASTFFARTQSRTAASSGTGSPFWRASFFYRYVVPAEIPLQCRSFQGVDNAPLHHIEIQRCILIFPGLVPVLITVSPTVFFPVRPSLVAIRCSVSIQLVCSSLFSCHNRGSRAEVV